MQPNNTYGGPQRQGPQHSAPQYGGGPQHGAMYGAPPQQPRRKRRIWPWFLVGALVLIAICGGIGIAMIGGAAKAVHDSTTATHTVTYKITGKGSATITYIGSNFSEAQQDAPLPWTHTETVTGWQPVTINAQLKGTGSVTCEIDVDGHAGKPITSTGQYVIASCSADTIPDA